MVRLLVVLVLVVASVNAQTYTSGDWRYTISNGEATITGYTGSGGAVAIPSEINGAPVIGIGDYSLFNQNTLTSVTIPNSVTSIGGAAFGRCTSLTSVTIPNSVTSIEHSAFQNCTSLTSITIPDSVTMIGSYAFSYCSLTSMTFLGNAPSFGLDPFYATPPFTLFYTQGTTGWGATFAGRQTTLSGDFSLTLASSDHTKGAVTNSPSGNSFSSGTSVSVSAIAVAGYAFTAWSGDSTSTNNPLVLVMNTNKAVTANFGPDNGDTDGDGLSNYQEVMVFNTNPNQPETNSPVAGLYLASQYQANWNNGRTAGRSEVTNTPNSFGLYTTNQIHNLGLGGIVLNRNTNNQLVLNYQVLQSTDLQSWSPYQQTELVISNAPTNKMFLRVQAVGQ